MGKWMIMVVMILVSNCVCLLVNAGDGMYFEVTCVKGVDGENVKVKKVEALRETEDGEIESLGSLEMEGSDEDSFVLYVGKEEESDALTKRALKGEVVKQWGTGIFEDEHALSKNGRLPKKEEQKAILQSSVLALRKELEMREALVKKEVISNAVSKIIAKTCPHVASEEYNTLYFKADNSDEHKGAITRRHEGVVVAWIDYTRTRHSHLLHNFISSFDFCHYMDAMVNHLEEEYKGSTWKTDNEYTIEMDVPEKGVMTLWIDLIKEKQI